MTHDAAKPFAFDSPAVQLTLDGLIDTHRWYAQAGMAVAREAAKIDAVMFAEFGKRLKQQAITVLPGKNELSLQFGIWCQDKASNGEALMNEYINNREARRAKHPYNVDGL
jgi:hypothetical protein